MDKRIPPPHLLSNRQLIILVVGVVIASVSWLFPNWYYPCSSFDFSAGRHFRAGQPPKLKISDHINQHACLGLYSEEEFAIAEIDNAASLESPALLLLAIGVSLFSGTVLRKLTSIFIFLIGLFLLFAKLALVDFILSR